MKQLATVVMDRCIQALPEVFASALAAALAWLLAQLLFGHERPIFAAISAIVCLSPGLDNHTKQTVGLMIGVATGIVLGELSLVLPDELTLLRVALAAFFAMMVAASYGQAPVVPIQAGISAILVVALGPATTGLVRMIDVGVGAALGILFSRVLEALESRNQSRTTPRNRP